MSKMLLPSTVLGTWSVGLGLTVFILFAVFLGFVASGQRGGDTFFSNLLLAIPILLAGIVGVFALSTGIIGVVVFKDRSILVLLAAAIGLVVTLVGLGEVVFPH